MIVRVIMSIMEEWANIGMTQKEKSLIQGKDIDTWYNYIFEELQKRYSFLTTDKGEVWFISAEESFHLCLFEAPLYGFIIEYAEGKDESDFIGAEDGRQWPILDYKTPEDMLESMIEEIET